MSRLAVSGNEEKCQLQAQLVEKDVIFTHSPESAPDGFLGAVISAIGLSICQSEIQLEFD